VSKLLTSPPLLADPVRRLAEGDPLAALHAQTTLLRTAPAHSTDLLHLAEDGDRLGRALALRPLAASRHPIASAVLERAARSDDPLLARQAVWALALLPPSDGGVDAVVAAVADGGLTAMHGRVTLERWSRHEPARVDPLLARRARREPDPSARARLVETCGLLGGPQGERAAMDAIGRDESEPVRAAAARGLATGPAGGDTRVLLQAATDGSPELRLACARALLSSPAPGARATAVSLARAVTGSESPSDRLLGAIVEPVPSVETARAGLRIAQVFVQGRLDGDLANVGAGDAGGLATLLVHLTRALAREPRVASVTTYARAVAERSTGWRHVERVEPLAPGARIERVHAGPPGALGAPALWEYRHELEHALDVAFASGVDVAHLRFADAGALAALRVCRRRRIPVVFTLAPDPHAVLADAIERGELTREAFAAAELQEHYLLRAHVVEEATAASSALALLPRHGNELGRLLGPAFARVPRSRQYVVPEGISLDTVDRAAARSSRPRAAVVELAGRIEALGAGRHGLPLLLSVGRFHRVKGLDRLVQAWAADDELHASLNLVLVGGELERPSEEERRVLGQIDVLRRSWSRMDDGLVLLGHRPNSDVAELLLAARTGDGGTIGPGGVYACASAKEEFGIALLEALAAGLVVVAPRAGGPATYVEHGRTGFLVDTSSVGAIAEGIRYALAAGTDETRAAHAARLVRSRYTVEAMARGLAAVYATTAGDARAA
jgi:glycosyltransferase involved in cell wall biosynthesis